MNIGCSFLRWPEPKLWVNTYVALCLHGVETCSCLLKDLLYQRKNWLFASVVLKAFFCFPQVAQTISWCSFKLLSAMLQVGFYFLLSAIGSERKNTLLLLWIISNMWIYSHTCSSLLPAPAWYRLNLGSHFFLLFWLTLRTIRGPPRRGTQDRIIVEY